MNIIYWNIFQPTSLALNSRKNYPPRLVIINDDNSINNCFVVGGGIQVDIGNDANNALTKLLFCYYVWDLSYPKQYQFLGFLQTYVLEDKENKFVKWVETIWSSHRSMRRYWNRSNCNFFLCIQHLPIYAKFE